MSQEELFERVEDKYCITSAQERILISKIRQHLKEDRYFTYTVQSIYFDNASNDVIIRSLMQPSYKMKLRLRCYGQPQEHSYAFLELKKKFGDIVYKRRISMDAGTAIDAIRRRDLPSDSVAAQEMEYLIRTKKLEPAILIAYERTAYSGIEEEDLRITFDHNIRYRRNPESLALTGKEALLYDSDTCILEIKAMDRYPLWLAEVLTSMKLYKRPFSKYGAIYTSEMPSAAPERTEILTEKEVQTCSVPSSVPYTALH